MEDDDLVRGQVAIVCSLGERRDGKVRLTMDDLTCIDPSFPQHWRTKSLFTWKEYADDQFFEMNLSEQELADIGLAIVSRLVALEAVRKKG